ncbi:MAG: glycosyltransferase [Bacteroidetes bacterium]|nr:glycosyltransferase [Bacteroidota bacterium]
MGSIVCFGPGPRFKGGIANYNTSLAKTLDREADLDVHIVSWTQQYPSIIPRKFEDTTSKTDFMEGTDIQIHYLTNYNNPVSWLKTARFIADLKPEKVIFQWAIAIQGIPMGFIARRLKKLCSAEIIFDLHFVVQKENSGLDQSLTRYGIKTAHTYLTHAYKTVKELEALYPNQLFKVNETGERVVSTGKSNEKTVIKLYHPVYDLYKPDPDFDIEAFKEQLGLKKHVFLFFGFIRKYKGLHNAIHAFSKLSKERNDVSFLICGEEFWSTLNPNKFSTKMKNVVFSGLKKVFLSKDSDEKDYRPLELISDLELEGSTYVNNSFIPNEEVHKYFQVADCSILFYETATPSGVESLTYNFELPILATRVGHFPETIQDGFNGYLAEAEDIDSMAQVMSKFIEQPLDRSHVKSSAENMSWSNYVKAILADLNT